MIIIIIIGSTLILRREGLYLIWHVTVTDSKAMSCLQSNTISADSSAEAAATR